MKPMQDIRRFRRTLNLNQLAFWEQFGITQSGGSRYENGRNIPRPVQMLMAQKYPELFGLPAAEHPPIQSLDPVLDYLQERYPKLYALLESELASVQGEAA